MKQVVGNFYNENKKDFETFKKLFEDNGYEVAKSSGAVYSAVVITDIPEEETEQTEIIG